MAREVVPSAQRISINVEEAIVERGKELDDTGVDAGAGTIPWHLGRRRWERALRQADCTGRLTLTDGDGRWLVKPQATVRAGR
jgi:hypothetical protein